MNEIDVPPPTCSFCNKKFKHDYQLWLHLVRKYSISFVKLIPRRLGKLVFIKHKFSAPILDGSIPVGFISHKGKKILYGKQYRRLYYWGRIK